MGSRWILCRVGIGEPLRLSGWVSPGLQRPLPAAKRPPCWKHHQLQPQLHRLMVQSPGAHHPGLGTVVSPPPWGPPCGSSGPRCSLFSGSGVSEVLGSIGVGGPQDRWGFPKGAEEAPAEGPREHTRVQQMA